MSLAAKLTTKQSEVLNKPISNSDDIPQHINGKIKTHLCFSVWPNKLFEKTRTYERTFTYNKCENVNV
jgi:hypothetical protein